MAVVKSNVTVGHIHRWQSNVYKSKKLKKSGHQSNPIDYWNTLLTSSMPPNKISRTNCKINTKTQVGDL